jgi:hypothetical protein
MDCPVCHARNPASTARCLRCDAPLPMDALTLTDGNDPSPTLDVDFAKDWSAAAAPQDESFGESRSYLRDIIVTAPCQSDLDRDN